MSDFNDILKRMAEDKNVKTVSIELKRMSGGIKLTYEARVGDETKMGLEFVNAKDFENDRGTLINAKIKMLGTIAEEFLPVREAEEKKE